MDTKAWVGAQERAEGRGGAVQGLEGTKVRLPDCRLFGVLAAEGVKDLRV